MSGIPESILRRINHVITTISDDHPHAVHGISDEGTFHRSSGINAEYGRLGLIKKRPLEMILLEQLNTIVRDLILQRLNSEKPTPIDTKCSDFDGCQLYVWSEKDVVNLALKSGAASSLLANGGLEILRQVYGSSLTDQPTPGYDVTISENVSSISPADRQAFATKFAQLKTHLYAAPITRCFQAASSNQVLPGLADLPIRSQNERMWVKQDDTERVTVIFSVDFTDPDDVVFGRVFLNEIKKPVSGSPTVDFVVKTPPLELKGVTNPPLGSNVSYVTFVIFKRLWTPAQKMQPCAFTLSSFRNYLHYHIKCCKSLLHTRMRLRVETLLQVLNRAKLQDVPVEKKTATGRTFVKK
eukprot:TRINITY_DN7095_c0_g1_i9.p1 TRINITY_DN7095_c0_g1~~TRINITY_DN7095_c0_g1_i9.p1  ORF type:complete len:355 (-),score=42.80 TRINITY_DN7095_c0_g1_i9:51-1115(-)